ncbi:chromosome segregation protein SMC [Pseudothioclava arenosa]|uniref:Chromosome partition protein Smc n=1 Tax=Pseudothioclava arenosa TaxID=1795308 RepID=A0A2A4CQA9_9RHOB|nr:chromosome segregation protein SMC [Pseudothioclava arenosa]PCD76510.1 chromosome segregation protein SMC [Pseudothioclava arenosa]
MRFTRLRLTGFKSFVDPTDLVIHDGLTGVVGPNGCGKSNLLEALRWVMGENRPTAMRGEGMEDVIFAGAASRPARNFAEVSLQIDNTERLAPSGFNDSDGLEIVRRITRDAGSAYKVNTKDVRARDVQMLFADASTGAHSPALVRQGQIAELINAKPKARRRILEEAAGISGLYQRRHEAELKLKGAEQNLLRVDDVIEQLAQQLATLARQARQAARYRTIGEELRRAEGMLLYRRWREAEIAKSEAEAAHQTTIRAAGQAELSAREAAKARTAREEALPPLREEEAVAAAILQRLLVQRDALGTQEAEAAARIETLQNRIGQLLRDMEREAGLNRDAGETIQRLEWEQAQITKAAEGHEDRLAAAASDAQEAGDVLSAREAQLSQLTEDVARLAARHQSAQRLLSDSRSTAEKSTAAASAAKLAAETATAALDKAKGDFTRAEAAQAEAQAASEAAETALAKADDLRAETQARETAARAARSEAEGESGALRAEVSALARLVEREAATGKQLLDRVRVDKGFEAALGAALADDLRAPEVSGEAATGWAALPDYDRAQSLPDGVAPLSDQVDVPDVLRRRISQIGLVADYDEGLRLQSLLKPGQRLVSMEGDLWRWDGFRAGAEDAPTAAALRLQQLNRLVELKRDLEEAEAKAAGAKQAHEALSAELRAATEADRLAREARRSADHKLADAGRALSRAEADRSIAGSKLESARMAVSRHEEEAMVARAALLEAERGFEALPDLKAAREEVDAIKITVEAARVTMMTKRAGHDEIRREGEARTRRRQEIIKEISGWRHRLETAEKRSAELALRRDETEAELTEASARPGQLAEARAALSEQITSAEARKATATDALAGAETALREAQLAEREAERLAGEARERRARAEARLDAAREVIKAAAERIFEETEMHPAKLLESLDCDPDAMPDAEALETEVNRLKRQREALGAVNLRAEEDAIEVQTEHDQLVKEKADLEEAIRKLRAGISGLNREGRERLLTAFEQVNDSFRTLFTHLFGGGTADLQLVESDDPLEAGLEIMCQPPGKKLSTLSLLSGGEQTLTAMALIFAVFLANPAPICVLDEVDAPLDDANVTRFCDLLDEMTRRTDTRFLIITHHAVTMSRMDRLFGVTMQEQGVSQLVSVDLKRAEQLVA